MSDPIPGSIDLTQPQSIMDWARGVEPEGLETSRAKLQSDRFVAEALARHMRIAYTCIDAVMNEPIDEIDSLEC